MGGFDQGWGKKWADLMDFEGFGVCFLCFLCFCVFFFLFFFVVEKKKMFFFDKTLRAPASFLINRLF
jgi:hypothetical protein